MTKKPKDEYKSCKYCGLFTHNDKEYHDSCNISFLVGKQEGYAKALEDVEEILKEFVWVNDDDSKTLGYKKLEELKKRGGL